MADRSSTARPVLAFPIVTLIAASCLHYYNMAVVDVFWWGDSYIGEGILFITSFDSEDDWRTRSERTGRDPVDLRDGNLRTVVGMWVGLFCLEIFHLDRTFVMVLLRLSAFKRGSHL